MTTATADVLSLIATLYGVGAATSALLQARPMLRLGSAQAVSARFLAIYAGGYAVWLLYGVSIDSLPLIVVDAVGLVCGGFTLAVTLRLRSAGGSPTRGRARPAVLRHLAVRRGVGHRPGTCPALTSRRLERRIALLGPPGH